MGRVLLIGTSCRAVAWSARRALLHPVCIDRFHDLDLSHVSELLDIPDDSYLDVCLGMHTFDSHMLLSEFHPWWFKPPAWCGTRWGCDPTVLYRISPPTLYHLVKQLGGTMPRTLTTPPNCSDSAGKFNWLCKPYRSGGGVGIMHWASQQAVDQTTSNKTEPKSYSKHHYNNSYYYQEYVPGTPYAALFVGFADRQLLVGITQQLIGDFLAAPANPFTYCGSVGPIELPFEVLETVERLGCDLGANITGLRGLWGLDFVWDGKDVWVIEVNPRYTASCEIHELARGIALLSAHRSACLDLSPTDAVTYRMWGAQNSDSIQYESRRSSSQEIANTSSQMTKCLGNNSQCLYPCIGKLIVYADRPCRAPAHWSDAIPCSLWEIPQIADIPLPGTRFAPGEPICTVFASAACVKTCVAALHERAKEVRRELLPA